MVARVVCQPAGRRLGLGHPLANLGLVAACTLVCWLGWISGLGVDMSGFGRGEELELLELPSGLAANPFLRARRPLRLIDALMRHRDGTAREAPPSGFPRVWLSAHHHEFISDALVHDFYGPASATSPRCRACIGTADVHVVGCNEAPGRRC